jgi:hypothetical protein
MEHCGGRQVQRIPDGPVWGSTVSDGDHLVNDLARAGLVPRLIEK